MRSMREFIAEASQSKVALGHFNFATMEMLRGIVEAAKEMNASVIVGASEGERSFMGDRQIRALVTAFIQEFNISIFLNADHTKTFERAKEAIDAGFDSVVVDGSAYSLSENIAMVKKVVDYGKIGGRDVVVEGELGFIGTSSQILDGLPPGVPIEESKMTSPEEAKKLVTESGADLFAPAVGNVHGVLREGGNPPLSIKRLAEIRAACQVPLVLHGASGVTEGDVKGAVKAGAAIVHFSTDLRMAYKKALAGALTASPEEMSPYKYLRNGIKELKEAVKTKISWLS